MIQKFMSRFTNKTQKYTFFAGVTILLILLIGFIISWTDVVKETTQSWNKLPIETRQVLLENNYIPNMQALFWQRTLTFTYISNFTIGLSLIIYALKPSSIKANNFVILSAIYISVTYIIFWTLIFPGLFTTKGYTPTRLLVSITTHFLNPFIGLFFVLWNKKTLVYSNKLILWSIAPMLVYYLFAMGIYFIGNHFTKEANPELFTSSNHKEIAKLQDNSGITIYPFLNFNYPLFYKKGSLVLVIIFNLFIVAIGSLLPLGIGFALKSLSKIRLQRKQNE